jgi:hypothetical protein
MIYVNTFDFDVLNNGLREEPVPPPPAILEA